MEIFWSTDVLWKQKLENYRIGNSEGAILEFRDFEATLFREKEAYLPRALTKKKKYRTFVAHLSTAVA